jgi:hypothetical protein
MEEVHRRSRAGGQRRMKGLKCPSRVQVSPVSVSSVRWLAHDPVLVGCMLWTAIACARFFAVGGGDASQVRIFWLFQPPLDAVLARGARRGASGRQTGGSARLRMGSRKRQGSA